MEEREEGYYHVVLKGKEYIAQYTGRGDEDLGCWFMANLDKTRGKIWIFSHPYRNDHHFDFIGNKVD